MIHTHSLSDLSFKDTWLTIGVFDGVHRGHQVLLRRLVDGAHAAGAPAVVITFHPHPAVVLGGKTDFKCLTTPGERAELLDGLGVDAVITQTFDRPFADQTAGEYMRCVVQTLGLRHLLVGYDFALGHGREGNLTRLKELGNELGYQVEALQPVHAGENIISSTAIRNSIRDGAVAEAAGLLGRLYAVSGPVIPGDGRGRTIQFPTANIGYPSEKLIPARGIYACWAWIAGERHAAATNIGINPTFTPDKTTSNVEAYLLDFSGDLYGQEVRLEFVQRLRDEMEFPSVETLVEQIRSDVAHTRAVLK